MNTSLIRFSLIFILVFFCLFHSATVYAQGRLNLFYSLENLQSKELIKGVAKDKEGYVWIATDDGVLRYDGYQTRMIYRDLPSAFTKGFLSRNDSTFHVLSDLGLNEIVTINDSLFVAPFKYDGNILDEALDFPKSVFEDQHGTVWIGEWNDVVRINKDGLKRFDLDPSFESRDYHRSFSFAEDAFGNLWIAPFKGPLLRYDRARDELEEIGYEIAVTQVRDLACVKGDHLLIGATEGLLILKTDSDHQILDAELLGGINEISSIEILNPFNIYVGTKNDGLYHFGLDNASRIFWKVSEVPIADIVDLFLDVAHDELWVAGSEQVGMLKQSTISLLRPVGQNRIESFGFHQGSDLYYSVGERLYHLADPFAGTPQPVFEIPDSYISRIFIEGDRLWIGDAFGGIYSIDLANNQRKMLQRGQDINAVQYLISDHYRNKWFTGHSKGLLKVDSTEEIRLYPEVKQSVLVRESPDGNLFCGAIGKNNLMLRYDSSNDTWHVVEAEYEFDAPDNLQLFDFGFSSGNVIWLGTNIGLLKMSLSEQTGNATVERIVIEGLDMEAPARAIATTEDLVYFANAQGLFVYNGHDYIHFDRESGLPSNILKERGLAIDGDGNLLIATAKGLGFIKKEDIRFEKTTPPKAKRILINGRPFSSAFVKDQSFPYKTRVEAEFIALNYPSSNVLYQTRMAGLAHEWSAPSSNRNVNVVSMADGEYAIEVRAREQGKLWSDPFILEMNVSPPWYRTWWAVLLFAGAGVGAVIGASKIRHDSLIKQKKTLQRIVEERSREIDRQKNEIIEQQNHLIRQKEELLAKNEAVYRSQKALIEADVNFLHLKEKQLQEQIEYKNKQITTHALHILQKNETLRHLKKQLEEVVRNSQKISTTEIRRTLRTIDESFKLDKDWEDFKLYFEQIHSGFYSKLKLQYPDLTQLELRHCALIRLNLTLQECASILGISHDSIKVARTRLRKKLNLEPSQNLNDFILSV